MDGNQVRALTSGNYDLDSFLGVDEDNGFVYYLARTGTPLTNDLYRVGLDGRGLLRLTHSSGTHRPSFSNGFRYFINNFSTAASPPRYSTHEADGRLIEVLEDNETLVQRINLHYSQKANKLLYLTELMIPRSKASKNSICLLFSGAFTLGHLLRCESLEIDYYVCGFRRLASDPN